MVTSKKDKENNKFYDLSGNLVGKIKLIGAGKADEGRTESPLNMRDEAPLVSICCITYNHERYIGEALDSFLKQDCGFSYEILIHDDASKDGTRAVIESYQERYGDIIKPIFQTENQYQKGITNPSGVFNFPRARGKYIAMCEGDDFWIDMRKLRIQAEYMEAHPECSMYCHAARIVSMDDSFRELSQLRPFHNDGVLSAGSVISKPANFPTASLFFRTEYAKELPDWYYDCPVGDIPLQLFMLLKGNVYYSNRLMSAYRVGNEGSWNSMMAEGSRKETDLRWDRHFEAMEKLYRAFDKDSGGRYKEFVAEAVERERFKAEVNKGNLRVCREEKNLKFFKELPPLQRSLVRLRLSWPGAYELMERTWRFLQKRKEA